MCKRLFKAVITSALLTTALTSTVYAASVEEIKKRAAEINELKSLVNDADSAMRLAAIDTMQISEDLAMKEMAFSAGFNSSDEAVVALTIRNRFSEIDNFLVVLVKPEEDGKPQDKYKEYGGQVMMKILGYDKSKGTLTTIDHFNNSKRQTTISGTNLFVESNYCQGGFSLADDLVYRGNITCGGQLFEANISLF